MNLRNFNPDEDIPALARLVAAIQGGAPDEEMILSQLKSDGHDPARDRWVIEHPDQPGEFMAQGWIRFQTVQRAIFGGAVLDGWRRQGLGSLLLARAIARAQELKAGEITVYVDAKDDGARAFLERNGFGAVGDAWEMHAPGGMSIPAPEFPTGYFLRTYSELQHLPTLTALLNRAYYDLYGHAENFPGTVTVEYVGGQFERRPELYPPDGMYILLNMFGKAVGFIRAYRGSVIDAPGIVPEERRNNLHLPLLLTAMRHLRNQGAEALRLYSCGDIPETIETYKRSGFSLVARQIAFERGLPPGDEASVIPPK